jgi:hypothetical protein
VYKNLITFFISSNRDKWFQILHIPGNFQRKKYIFRKGISNRWGSQFVEISMKIWKMCIEIFWRLKLKDLLMWWLLASLRIQWLILIVIVTWKFDLIEDIRGSFNYLIWLLLMFCWFTDSAILMRASSVHFSTVSYKW